MTLLDRLGGRQAIMQGVEETFRLLSRHPHPSHGEELTCRDYAAFLREKLGAEPVEDSVHNLMCTLPASSGRPKDWAAQVLAQAGIPPLARAEQLTVEQFAALADALAGASLSQGET